MARITVQKAVEKVGNVFDLILIAANKARNIQNSERMSILSNTNDKCTVTALKEIEKNYSIYD
ncbi:MAG: DNA-directed RNA polymerase subunit omega [Candidatus Lightella neohaematopini]|nr:DNA-directed RNA polymerase subunit omega [Candidatus Lightella neohaematopini]MCV2524921.1 DNA-directed RNA polymerase subunit omega [Candidatus Lightella neohaematopini]